jgi:hypothetical protein
VSWRTVAVVGTCPHRRPGVVNSPGRPARHRVPAGPVHLGRARTGVYRAHAAQPHAASSAHVAAVGRVPGPLAPVVPPRPRHDMANRKRPQGSTRTAVGSLTRTHSGLSDSSGILQEPGLSTHHFREAAVGGHVVNRVHENGPRGLPAQFEIVKRCAQFE